MKRLHSPPLCHLVALLTPAILAALVLGIPAIADQAEQGKLPEPDKTAVAKSEKILNKMFKEELTKAKTDSAAARELAEVLLREARQTSEDPPLRYIALCYARDLAAQAGDIGNAMSAIEELAKHYAVEVLATKAKMLVLAAEKVTAKEDHQTIVDAALSLLAECLAQDNYKAADELVKAAEESAVKSKNLQSAARVEKVSQEVDQAKKEFGRMQQFVDILAKDPTNAAANAEMGKYICLVKGNWERGLPMLVKSGDKLFLELAKRDLANPKDTRGQLDLGDDYATLADDEKGLAQKMLLKRALHWYAQCLPNLDGGLNKLRVEKAVEEIAKLFPTAPPTFTTAANVPITTLIRTFEAKGGHFNGVQALAISPDSKWVVSGGIEEGIVRLWEVASGKQIRQLQGHKEEIWSLAFSPDGTQCASGSKDKTMRTWDVSTGNALRTFQGHKDWVRGVHFLPDKARILTASDDHTLRLWNLKDGATQKSITGHSNYITCLSVSRDGRRAATSSEDNSVRVWDVDQGKELARFTQEKYVWAVALSADGKKVATAAINNVCKIWDVNAKKEIHTLAMPTRAWSVAFAPSGKMVVFGTGGVAMAVPAASIEGGWPQVGVIDNSLYFWDVDNSKPLRRLTGHTGFVRALAYGNDGRVLVSGGDDNTIRVWSEGKK